MRRVPKLVGLGPVLLLALIAVWSSFNSVAGSTLNWAATAAATTSTKPIAVFALCKAPTPTPTPRPTRGPSPTADTAPTEVPPTATEVAPTAAATKAPTVVPPTEVPITPTAIPKGQKPATAGVTLGFQAGLVRAFGRCISITGVTAGGPADAAGIQVGDLILGLDRYQVKDAGDFYAQVGRHSSGDVVTITVQREDKAMSLKVTLGLNQFAEVATPTK